MIELHGLNKTFGEIKAVDDLSLTVQKGTTVGFLGPNGAGKTTTIKILTNLISATGGRALLNGVDVVTDPKTALSHVGAVVETPEFYPFLTPMETLAYLGSIRGMHADEIKRRSDAVLEEVKMDQWKTTRVGKFSKGMKQRLAIAQALLHEPEVLILDEPTSGLDPRGMVEVREIVKGLKKQHYTIFMSSHLLPEVQEVCDSAALIDHGRLLAYDTIENMKRLTKVAKIEVTTAADMGDALVSRIRSMRGVRLAELATARALVITYEGAFEDRADLLTSIQGEGVKVTGFSPIGLPLETLYMDLVKESR
ncbi:MAG: ABC transporter ATP-binding protein [Thermoplasmata archaeon]|jgi:ABC-2 type transport system ATP-binding protein|nr:ABC transporter ATP-binding protein [Thermoplasmata archaeon]